MQTRSILRGLAAGACFAIALLGIGMLQLLAQLSDTTLLALAAQRPLLIGLQLLGVVTAAATGVALLIAARRER